VFLNGEAYADGGVGLGIGGGYGLVPLVSQGCEPIGEAWTITGVQDHWIETISNRPAVDVLVETLSALPEELQPRAQQNLVVGIAADEYRHEFVRGDFLVRNLIGLDRGSGAIAIGALPRLGQTIQFQVRDAATADLDLTLMLDDLRPRLAGRRPLAAVLNSCNGRGVGLFGSSHHDATAIDRKLGPLPLAGLFCAGEIGPVGTTSYLHGFTASLGLIVRTDSALGPHVAVHFVGELALAPAARTRTLVTGKKRSERGREDGDRSARTGAGAGAGVRGDAGRRQRRVHSPGSGARVSARVLGAARRDAGRWHVGGTRPRRGGGAGATGVDCDWVGSGRLALFVSPGVRRAA
jgi:hypothetical protein